MLITHLLLRPRKGDANNTMCISHSNTALRKEFRSDRSRKSLILYAGDFSNTTRYLSNPLSTNRLLKIPKELHISSTTQHVSADINRGMAMVYAD